jgi:hypothetical protein
MSEKVLEGKMTLENSGFVEKMNKARESAGEALKTFKEVALGLTGLGSAMAAFQGSEAFTEGIKSAIETGRAFAVQARQMSTSVAQVVELRRAFEEAGVGADGAGTAVYMLNKALGGVSEEGVPTATAFQRIGLSIAELKKQSPVEQFRAIIAGLNKLPDSATRANVAAQIFGRGARDLQAILADPKGFNEAIEGSEAYAQIMQKNAPAFETVSKAVEGLQVKTKEFYAGLASGVAPILERVLALTSKIDFAKLGAGFGRAIALVGEAFKQGTLGDIVKDALVAGFDVAINTLVGAFTAAVQGLGAALGAVFSSDFWLGLAAGFKGVAEMFVGYLMSQLPQVFDGLQSISDHFKALATGQSYESYKKKREDDELKAYIKQTGASFDQSDPVNQFDSIDNKDVDRLMDQRAHGVDPMYYSKANPDEYGFPQLTRLSQIQKTGNSFLGGQANDFQRKGSSDIDAAKGLLKPVGDAVAQAVAAAVKSYQQAKVLDPGEATKDLATKLAQLNASLDSRGGKDEEGEKKGVDTPAGASSSLALKMPEGDRLAKLGLFIGGAPATPGLTEARRTANATEKALRTLDTLVDVTKSLGGNLNTNAFAN